MSEEKKSEVNPFRPPPISQQKLESTSRDAGYDVPVEGVPLPSKGLVYSLDHPLCNEEMVDIRCMCAREEDLLTSRALIKAGTVITKLLESCILNKTVNPDDLLVGDRNAILISIRITGYGSTYSAKIQCPECDEQFENEFSLEGLRIKTLGAMPLQRNVNLFSFTLPRTNREVHFKLLTGREEGEISQAETRRKKLGNQVETSVTSRLVHSIVSIDGETDKGKINRQVMNMAAIESRALRSYIEKIEPGVEMKQWAKCTQCGEESEVGVPLGISFFWPDLG